MIVREVKLKNYRNISSLDILPCETVNIIYGDNAQGKTNILESVWLFTGNASFRGGKQVELVKFEENSAKISLLFSNSEREQLAQIEIGAQKKMFLNNVPLKKASDLAGNFYCVVFSPEDLDFVKGAPVHRRRFLDLSISQITPQYLSYLEQYTKVLEQRNALLRDIPENPRLEETLYIWNSQLAKLGTILSIYRRDYSLKLGKIAQNIYAGISRNQEEFEVKYVSSIFGEDDEIKYDDYFINKYEQELVSNTEIDIRRGFTTRGIQRDDLELFVNKISLKTYGSQGQQRSGVLTLKLSEADLLKAVTGENPVILLDDVMSELDLKRQDYILNKVRKKQVFITCCDPQSFKALKIGKVFKVENGAVREQEREQ